MSNVHSTYIDDQLGYTHFRLKPWAPVDEIEQWCIDNLDDSGYTGWKSRWVNRVQQYEVILRDEADATFFLLRWS